MSVEPVPAEIIAAALDVEPAVVEPAVATPSTEPVASATTAEPAAAGRTGWRERLRGSTFARSFSGLFSRHPVRADLANRVDELNRRRRVTIVREL